MKLFLVAMALCAMAFSAIADTSNRAAALLRTLEGFSPKVYRCTAGKPTIGYGFTSTDIIAKGIISKAEADAILKNLCTEICQKLRTELGDSISLEVHEEAAVVSFIYNVGWTNFRSSTMFRLLKEGKRGAIVGREFRRWVYITKNGVKTVSKGLENRRKAEAMLFMCG